MDAVGIIFCSVRYSETCRGLLKGKVQPYSTNGYGVDVIFVDYVLCLASCCSFNVKAGGVGFIYYICRGSRPRTTISPFINLVLSRVATVTVVNGGATGFANGSGRPVGFLTKRVVILG